MTKMTDADVARAYSLQQGGKNINEIARTFRVSRTTIYRRLKAFERENRLGVKKRERVDKLTRRDKERIRQYLEREPFATNAEVIASLGLGISQCTLARVCKKLGLPKFRSPKKFYVDPENCDERMRVANRCLQWTSDQWKKVVFCDEAGLDNSGAQLKTVRRPRGERFNRDYIYRHPNKSLRINYFSWVSKFGVGNLIVYKKMNAKVLCRDVIPFMIESLRAQFGSDNFRIIHDNAKFFTCDYTTLYLFHTGFDKFFLPIPPYSPDMNLIENLWAYLRQKVKEQCFLNGQTRKRKDFIREVRNVWNSIPNSIIDNLYQSLPRRMEAIVRAEGYPTRY